MLKRRLAASLITAAATGLAVFGAGGTAQAANDYLIVYGVGSNSAGGQIGHIDDGDSFEVKDLMADGHGVRGTLYNEDFVVLKSSYNGNGNNSTTRFSYDVKGGVRYYMRICLVDGYTDTSPVKCATESIAE
ncbi:hypothetical protein [Phytomonospora endophytica]|uniref:Secreted protein n=1 Tax=Phytomonospora endophytica TaxID=714109 RepID=A0A841FRR3_9ACTN|nr:hypothetical protein [Phytomonospora endophytica]MBB6038935.1 hypothetical protein [Phytomonospora endophytica]GIG67963.1 hypothetical protein Pen01_42580 [Phytomonospora endophytica]